VDYEEEDGGFSEKFSGVTEKARDFVGKAGASKIVLALLIISVVYWGLFLRPSPGSLSISVVELDSGEAIVGAEVIIYSENGEQIELDYTDNSGSVRFQGVPSREELTIEVGPGVQHKTRAESIQIESGENADLQVRVERDWSLEVGAVSRQYYAGAGCIATVSLMITNKGDAAVPIEFVGTGDLAGLLVTSARALNAKTKEAMEVQIAVPNEEKAGSELSGKVRVKYSNAGETISINVLETPSLDLSPNSIKVKLGEGESGFVEMLELSIDEEGIELDASCRAVGSDLQGKISISDVNPNEKLTSAKPKLFKLTFGPFTQGEHAGQIICETSCEEKTINVIIEK
jgi:hypothetical protein